MRAFAALFWEGSPASGVVIGGLILGIIENFWLCLAGKPIVAFVVIILINTVRPGECS